MNLFRLNLIMGALGAWPSFVPYLVVVAAFSAVVTMYLSLRREIIAQASRNRRVEAMLARLKEAALGSNQSPEPLVAPDPVILPPLPRAGMNLNRRVQALRLLRRGEDLSFIAAAIGVPRCEVELLVRIHQLTATARPARNASTTSLPVGIPEIEPATPMSR